MFLSTPIRLLSSAWARTRNLTPATAAIGPALNTSPSTRSICATAMCIAASRVLTQVSGPSPGGPSRTGLSQTFPTGERAAQECGTAQLVVADLGSQVIEGPTCG